MTSGEGLNGVWGDSNGGVIAVGGGGTILRYADGTWNSMASPTTKILRGVWGVAANDIFAIGDRGVILHYDGNTWSQYAFVTDQDFAALDSSVVHKHVQARELFFHPLIELRTLFLPREIAYPGLEFRKVPPRLRKLLIAPAASFLTWPFT